MTRLWHEVKHPVSQSFSQKPHMAEKSQQAKVLLCFQHCDSVIFT